MSFRSSTLSRLRAAGMPGLAGIALPLLLLLAPLPAGAQDYFVPGNARPAAPPAPRSAPRPAPRPASPSPSQSQQPAQQAPQEAEEQPIQLPMPKVPDLAPLPRGVTPPVAVIGVIGVPEVMRASTAAQQIDRVIGERRERLGADAQKEQIAWRDLNQSLANQRNTISPEQIRARERELQERITSAQRQFRDRNRVIQEAAQAGLNQIQSALIAIIRQVSESRGMNLVLQRAQVALNVNEFDITEQVTAQLNRLLPTVNLPADGVSVAGQTPGPVPILANANQPAAGAAPLPPTLPTLAPVQVPPTTPPAAGTKP